MILGGHCVKTYSQTQETIALSSGESEFVWGSGVKGPPGDLGVEVKAQVKADSSAAKNTAL